MPQPVRSKTKYFQITVDRELHAALKRAAADDNRSMQQYVLVAIREKMERQFQRSNSLPWIPSGVRRMS